MKLAKVLGVVAILCAMAGLPVVACGGMTTIDPPSLTLEDPVDAPTIDTDPDEWGEGEVIL